MYSLTHYQHPSPEWYVFIIDESTLIHHNQPKSIVYIRIHSWCCTFYGFGQMYNDMCIHHYSIIQSCFANVKILCAPPIHPSFSTNPWQPLIFLPSPQFLPFPECHIVGIIQYVTFSKWFILLSNMHLRFLHVFSWLDSPFVFSTE